MRRETSRQSPRESHAAPPPAPKLDAAHADRAALVLWAAVALVVAARAALSFAPGMQAWGFNTLRFTPAAFGWPLWALSVAALVPPLGARLAPWLGRAGDAVAWRPWVAGGVLGAGVASLVALVPDRLWLLGDFLLRLNGTRGQLSPDLVFPQAMPLDLWIHHDLPVALAARGLSDPNHWERLLGAVEAALLSVLSVSFARGLGLTGVAAAVAAAAVASSGLLAMFTGYGKGFVELTLLTVAAGVLALRLAREGRGAWALALVVSLALGFHRSALALFVPLAAAAWTWGRSPAARGPGRARILAAFVAPAIVAATLAPRMLEAMRRIDARHLAPHGASLGAALGAALSPSHLLGIVNLVAQASPLVLAAPALAIALGPGLRARRREWAVLAAMTGAAFLVLLFVHPQQGVFRDADVFAPSLAGLALASAALVGEALRGSGTRAWIGAGAVFATLVPTVQHLVVHADVEAGLRRTTAYLEEAPRRTADERGLMWGFVAKRARELGRRDQAAAAYARAAELVPSPRILTEWALAEQERGDHGAAQRIYRLLVSRAATFPDAWIGLADASLRIGDLAEARRAAERARALSPRRSEPLALLRAIALEESTRALR